MSIGCFRFLPPYVYSSNYTDRGLRQVVRCRTHTTELKAAAQVHTQTNTSESAPSLVHPSPKLPGQRLI